MLFWEGSLANAFAAEEVYFGKAKDVVGDLRSMVFLLIFFPLRFLICCRYTTSERCKQGESDTSGDDQFDEAVIGSLA